ncbi:hypothetical protein DPMN_114483 [Dreissena polymorpha]|uniref:Uncharacterized protein n=1 Tax=Dreissena polymorpha TaxID=45954 RepID=A0A9D4KK52_DREPO|nr:hypothetical protein DPMN_114483 [Dreissena polymorpha]
MLPSFRIFTDQHGSFELPKTAVFVSRRPKDIPERSRHTRIDTELHGGFMIHMPDCAGYDPC